MKSTATTDNGNTYWEANGKLHREDGPAIEWADGRESYYIEGNFLTKTQFLARQSAPLEGTVIMVGNTKYILTATPGNK